jgi:hypothetical protein
MIFSFGRNLFIEFATVSPPMPESKIPIGLFELKTIRDLVELLQDL